ncbi:MAG: hypothetical protein NZR01_07365 [Bryobacteraceae bacterium]|nr:hypothetical protein [Bryobacteraceae bacterium]
MNEWGATAVSFTLLSWVLLGWALFELWPELRAGKLRLRLRRMQLETPWEQNSAEMFARLEAAARHAEEIRWLPLLLSAERELTHPLEEQAAWEMARHAAWGAPWLWPALWSAAGRRRWMRRALGLAETLRRAQDSM